MREIPFNRKDAVDYARRWALDRNPKFYDFELLGGDCTNFASQCLFAGAGVMNPKPETGWFYRTASDRTASWTGVEYLFRFLVANSGVGPYGHIVPAEEVLPGDLVQLGDEKGRFYHSPVITETAPRLLVCAHSFDALDRPLSSYVFHQVRFLHIDGARRR